MEKSLRLVVAGIVLTALLAACGSSRTFQVTTVAEGVSIYEMDATQQRIYYVKQESPTQEALWVYDVTAAQTHRLASLQLPHADDRPAQIARDLVLLADGRLAVEYGLDHFLVDGDVLGPAYVSFYKYNLLNAQEYDTWYNSGVKGVLPTDMNQRLAQYFRDALAARDHIPYMAGFGRYANESFIYFVRDATGEFRLVESSMLETSLGQPFHELAPAKFQMLARGSNPAMRIERAANGRPAGFADNVSRVSLTHESTGDCSAIVARQPCRTWTVLRRGEQQVKFDSETLTPPGSLHLVAADGAVYLVSKGKLQAYR